MEVQCIGFMFLYIRNPNYEVRNQEMPFYETQLFSPRRTKNTHHLILNKLFSCKKLGSNANRSPRNGIWFDYSKSSLLEFFMNLWKFINNLPQEYFIHWPRFEGKYFDRIVITVVLNRHNTSLEYTKDYLQQLAITFYFSPEE